MINERLKKLRIEHNLTQAELADNLGIAKTTLASYEQGKNEPNIRTIIQISMFFKVSTDYLLGISETRSTNPEIALMSNYLGLTERSIIELHSARVYANNKNRLKQKLDTLNMLLEPHCDLLEHITDYLYFTATHFKKFSDKNKRSLSPISDLELWDDMEKVSYSEDWDLWSKALLLIVEEDLLSLREYHQVQKLATQTRNTTPSSFKPPTTE